MLDEGIEIAIVVEEHVAAADAAGRDDAVDGLAEGHTLASRRAEVPGGLDTHLVSGQGNHVERLEERLGPPEIALRGDAL